MAAIISPQAFVHPEAHVGNNVQVHPFAYIDANVEIGDNTIIRAHASILSGARIGRDNVIYEGAVISATPQDFRWKGCDSFVRIGNKTVIREHVIINRSIYKDGMTSVGSNSFIMAQTHIGHDSVIGNYCVLGNAVKIAGDVRIGNYSILSSNALVHEGYNIGEWVLIKGGTRVNGNVPPFCIMAHNPITYSGVNAFVMRKGKKTDQLIDDIAQCYRHIYQSNTSVFNALRRIEIDIPSSPERDQVLDFIRSHDLKLAAVKQDIFD